MPFDESLALRVRKTLTRERGIEERRMFGGLAFLLHGNMCCGVAGENLVVRVGPDDYEEALARKHVREMDFTGRPLRGFVYVDPHGCRTARDLSSWVDRGLRYARSLPVKGGKKS